MILAFTSLKIIFGDFELIPTFAPPAKISKKISSSLNNF